MRTYFVAAALLALVALGFAAAAQAAEVEFSLRSRGGDSRQR